MRKIIRLTLSLFSSPFLPFLPSPHSLSPSSLDHTSQPVDKYSQDMKAARAEGVRESASIAVHEERWKISFAAASVKYPASRSLIPALRAISAVDRCNTSVTVAILP